MLIPPGAPRRPPRQADDHFGLSPREPLFPRESYSEGRGRSAQHRLQIQQQPHELSQMERRKRHAMQGRTALAAAAAATVLATEADKEAGKGKQLPTSSSYLQPLLEPRDWYREVRTPALQLPPPPPPATARPPLLQQSPRVRWLQQRERERGEAKGGPDSSPKPLRAPSPPPSTLQLAAKYAAALSALKHAPDWHQHAEGLLAAFAKVQSRPRGPEAWTEQRGLEPLLLQPKGGVLPPAADVVSRLLDCPGWDAAALSPPAAPRQLHRLCSPHTAAATAAAAASVLRVAAASPPPPAPGSLARAAGERLQAPPRHEARAPGVVELLPLAAPPPQPLGAPAPAAGHTLRGDLRRSALRSRSAPAPARSAALEAPSVRAAPPPPLLGPSGRPQASVVAAATACTPCAARWTPPRQLRPVAPRTAGRTPPSRCRP
eukprot:TRINITY_DN6361_c0_g2_i3.p1 TRINITY_DN6361_c0_g2~~TRINITY_DN6361_c0_g2_i3.p1  ORF type:complete len:433 (+),score=118.91 TRINITY_DN6361_c0_g2_i3:111-1409(+)